MQTLQIRLPDKQLKKIDETVKRGIFRSRSEAIRDTIERMNFLAFFNEFQDIINKEKTKKKELRDIILEARKKLYRKYL